MGWRPLYMSWLNTLPETMDETDKTTIQNLMDWIIDPTLAKIRADFEEISPTIDQNLVVSFLRLFKAMLEDFADPDFYGKIEIEQRLDIID
jgi:dynein heavy chain